MEERKLINIEEWKKSHSRRFYLLYDPDKGEDGEGELIIISNNPNSFSSFKNQMEYEGKSFEIARGEI